MAEANNDKVRRVFLFPDTNVFIHSRIFTEVDWAQLSNANEAVLILTTTVLNQLDYRKERDDRLAVRQKVQTVLRKIKLGLDGDPDGSLRGGSSLKFFPKNARAWCERYDLDPEQTDQYIVATALAFREENANERVLIATGDFGMAILAQHHGLVVLQLPDNLHQSFDDDSDAKRIRQLQEELAKERARKPELSIGDRTGKSFVRVSFPDRNEALSALNATRASADAYLGKFRPFADPRESMLPGGIGYYDPNAISDGDRQSYNRELSNFKRLYREWLSKLESAVQAKIRTGSIELWLLNAGTAAAAQLIIELRFPKSITVQRTEPQRPRAPGPPEEPVPALVRSLTSMQGLAGTGLRRELRELAAATAKKPNVSTLKLSGSDSGTTATFEVEEVLHNVPISLGTLYLTWDENVTPSSLGIQFTIHTRSLAAPATGTVHAVVSELE